MLSVAGLAAYSMAPWIGIAVGAVMLIVIASYRQNVHAYPVRRRRLRGGDHQPRPDGRPHGGQRAAGGLRAHRRGVDGVGDVQHRIRGAVHQRAQGVGRRHRDRGPGFGEPARPSRVGHRVRHPDLRLHDRHVHHARLGSFSDQRARDAAARRVGGLRVARRARRHPRVRHGVPRCPCVLVRLRCADGRGGDQQRRARLSETQVPQRRNDVASAGRHRGVAVPRHHPAGQGNRREDRRAAARAADRRPARLPPEDADRPARRCGLPRFPAGAVPDRRRHRTDPGAGRQHGLQRLPRAGLDPGPGPLSAASAAHPRRPAGVLERHPVPGLGGDRVHRRVPGSSHRVDPALHRRRVRLVHAEPDRHGSALDAVAGGGERPRRARENETLAGDQRDRVDLHGHRARHRGGHQIRCGRVDRDPRDGRRCSC